MNNNENWFPEDSEKMKLPDTSNYLKFKTEGSYKFRALSSPIMGYVYFKKDNKPVRSREIPEELVNIKTGGKISLFWAFIVWNYQAKRLQILEVTQKTIHDQIKAYIKNPDWGNPKGYDLTITRQGLGQFDTEYSVTPSPHTNLDSSIVEAYKASKINLDALYEGLDPFTVDKN